MGDLQAVEVGEKLAVAGSESEDGDLFGSAKLVDVVSFSLDLQAPLPCGSEVAVTRPMSGVDLRPRKG